MPNKNPLTHIRKKQNMTTRELAKVLGVSCSSVTTYEIYDVLPKKETLLKYKKLDPTLDFNKLFNYYEEQGKNDETTHSNRKQNI